jgi:histone-lysine N-methyltransferase SETMAR
MGDETWVHYYEPESKRQSMEWQHTPSPAMKKFKSAPSAGKLMLTLFWDMNGPLLEHYQQKGETVNSVRYSTMLEEKLKPAICSRLRLLSKGILLLHDNAQPYTAATTVTTLQKLKSETINHPPYSPDLAPSNYHMFGMLTKAMRG